MGGGKFVLNYLKNLQTKEKSPENLETLCALISYFYSSIIQYSEWILRTAALATPLNSKLEGGKEGVRISSVT